MEAKKKIFEDTKSKVIVMIKEKIPTYEELVKESIEIIMTDLGDVHYHRAVELTVESFNNILRMSMLNKIEEIEVGINNLSQNIALRLKNNFL